MGGAALHLGWVAEMRTGEGKTLVSTLPVYLNGLTGEASTWSPSTTTWRAATPTGWARSTAGWASASALWSPGCGIRPSSGRSTPATSLTAPTTSSASTTCATTWPWRRPSRCSGVIATASWTEIDSILIDEARTPLIISGQVAEAANTYYRFASIVRRLERDETLRGGRGEAHGGAHRGRRRRRGAGPRRREPLRLGAGQLRAPPRRGPCGPRNSTGATRSTSCATAR